MAASVVWAKVVFKMYLMADGWWSSTNKWLLCTAREDAFSFWLSKHHSFSIISEKNCLINHFSYWKVNNVGLIRVW